MTNSNKAKKYDLDERTLEFGRRVVVLCKSLPRDLVNTELARQCIRSGTSIGANYLEANDSLGKKDFVYKMKISRKEAKETIYWLKLIVEANKKLESRMEGLLQEAFELKKILSSIIEKSK